MRLAPALLTAVISLPALVLCVRAEDAPPPAWAGQDTPEDLAALFRAIRAAVDGGDTTRAVALTRGLIPSQEELDQVLAADVDPAVKAKIAQGTGASNDLPILVPDGLGGCVGARRSGEAPTHETLDLIDLDRVPAYAGWGARPSRLTRYRSVGSRRGVTEGPRPRALVDALGSWSDEERQRAIDRIDARGIDVMPCVIERLKDETASSAQRARLVLSVARLARPRDPDERARVHGILCELALQDPTEAVQQAARHAFPLRYPVAGRFPPVRGRCGGVRGEAHPPWPEPVESPPASQGTGSTRTRVVWVR